ncbi:dipeptidase [Roseinatronobacter bogoriensis]|uniref:Dipeptidase n=1 Tax=Roseinatronobacter bogoriensis subsp. barguzinensis TaxID=441209 RepID=A0A2K8K5P9_9RHOB|nr:MULTISPECIES: dipeptidase [Rhodobaca]ATX64782.1 dipeptidase [Rhodobaca barguzinensis]MBB4208564.1 acetylornithine deacetylase/succinyl-diaminopimelate desuccinylase-like protein [Rhodobaca bogoriensis DSM 18756]TDW38167.1 acetylornithine deacetylase/succinyl-diaminopimelate desuccinylase-like protein [Rhodobaca barguzinensis]TDY69662.1 acetylornithine deacetylase/succinyl-diaminopimelate desuccinylase-like protein [Rhodobaca bogoriensis DSM 18756]
MTATITPVLAQIDQDLPQALERLSALLRIPSISTDPAHAADVDKAADWLVAELASLGFEARKDQTGGHPMVVAQGGAKDGPHLLFYGHYDVQPVDPLDLWESDPFDPQLQDTPKGKVIRARGASDDKGQLMTFIEACRAWLKVHDSLPVKLTFCLEGEEESGSPSLVPYLEANRDALRADLALICDTGLFDPQTPGITTMLRGLLGEEITIHGPARDLHSGSFGGAAMNPARVLARILADLHDENGRITLPGFYDYVPEISDDLRAQWDGLGFDPDAFLGGVGLSVPAGESGRTALEMIWARPTCEINGMISGYTGAGFKTVLPAQASAKVSFRLVGQQDPHKLRKVFREFVTARVPADCRVEFHEHGASPASVMETSHPAFEAARGALSDEWPKPAAFVGAGGSIPIAGYFKSILGMDSMLIGFANDDDQIHSPNEKYDLDSFHRGIRSWARILDAVSKA